VSLVLAPPATQPTLAALASRVRASYADAGFRGVWFGALGATCYRRLLVLERRLGAVPPGPADEIAVRIVELDDAHAYRALRPELPADEFVRRRASGAVCFAALAEGRVVGATWAQVGGGWCAYLERAIALRDDEAYLFDTLVDPSLRGRRIAPAIARAQMRALAGRGVGRLVATVLPENRASLRARARSGFVVCGRVGWFGIGRHRHHFARGLAAPGDAC